MGDDRDRVARADVVDDPVFVEAVEQDDERAEEEEERGGGR